MIFRILETFLLEPFASKPSATCLPWLIEMQLVPYVEGGGPEIASQLQNTLDVFVFWKRRESPAQHPRIILNCRVFGCSWLKCSMTSCSVILPKKNQSARKHVATLFWKPISASSVMTNVPNFQKNKRPALPTGQFPVTVCFCFSSVKTRRTSLAEPQVWSWNKWHVVSCKISAFQNGFPQFVFSQVDVLVPWWYQITILRTHACMYIDISRTMTVSEMFRTSHNTNFIWTFFHQVPLLQPFRRTTFFKTW